MLLIPSPIASGCKRNRVRTGCLSQCAGDKLLEFAVDCCRSRQIFPALERAIRPAIVGHKPSGFLDQDDPRRSVPEVEIVFQETVHPSGGYPGKIKRCRAEPSY